MSMRKLLASIHKELLILARDRAGLALLFVMPACLVLILTVIQENTLKTSVQVLFVDQDRQEIGRTLAGLMETSKTLEPVEPPYGTITDPDDLARTVMDNNYPFGILLPPGLTEAIHVRNRQKVDALLFGRQPDIAPYLPEVTLVVDPTVQGGFTAAVKSFLASAVQGIDQQVLLRCILERLPQRIRQDFPEALEPFGPEFPDGFSLDSLVGTSPGGFHIRETAAATTGFANNPTSVQHNVPAWTLFGIFFVAVPLATSLIGERKNQTLDRLRSMPVPAWTILTAKVAAYTLVCLLQAGVIVSIGRFVLPLFGVPAFAIGSSLGPLLLVLMSAVAAATGYGILLGTVAKTVRQASTAGPVLVVIASAVGGIMIPVYAMPKPLQDLAIVSPLGWAQNAFYDILLKGGGLAAALPEIAALVCLSTVFIAIACRAIQVR